MAKQLSAKVEHCPKCRRLKSKVGPCKSCGYGSSPAVERVKAYSIPGFDVATSKAIIINGVKFERK